MEILAKCLCACVNKTLLSYSNVASSHENANKKHTEKVTVMSTLLTFLALSVLQKEFEKYRSIM
jgi:hypothetical protein